MGLDNLEYKVTDFDHLQKSIKTLLKALEAAVLISSQYQISFFTSM